VGGTAMARRTWSDLFLLLAAVNLALGLLPRNPFRVVDWLAIPAFLSLGALTRRRML